MLHVWVSLYIRVPPSLISLNLMSHNIASLPILKLSSDLDEALHISEIASYKNKFDCYIFNSGMGSNRLGSFDSIYRVRYVIVCSLNKFHSWNNLISEVHITNRYFLQKCYLLTYQRLSYAFFITVSKLHDLYGWLALKNREIWPPLQEIYTCDVCYRAPCLMPVPTSKNCALLSLVECM